MESKVVDHTLVFSFSERLDTVEAMSLQKEIVDTIAAQDKSMPVIFDFSDVKYISSGFIRVLVIVFRMKDKHFSIVNINPRVKETLVLTGLDRLITMN
jgi:anti-anti-sigma factor